MTIEEKQNEIVDEFSIYDDWLEKYEYIIELGKDLNVIAEDKKTDDRLISGCQSKVWVDANYEDGKIHFSADSDAIITKGIIALLLRVYDNETPKDILAANLFFIDDLGLKEHLSPTRSNGLLGMIKKIEMLALANLNK